MKVKHLLECVFTIRETEKWLEFVVYTRYDEDIYEICREYHIKKKDLEIPKEILEAEIERVFIDHENTLAIKPI